MHYRSDELYINGKTKRRLRWVANAVWKGQITPDELADKLLNEVIEERWAQIKDAEQALAQAEQAFAESFKQ
jgi:CRISPR/Cas system-associated endoribonuclease Cas2